MFFGSTSATVQLIKVNSLLKIRKFRRWFCECFFGDKTRFSVFSGKNYPICIICTRSGFHGYILIIAPLWCNTEPPNDVAHLVALCALHHSSEQWLPLFRMLCPWPIASRSPAAYRRSLLFLLLVPKAIKEAQVVAVRILRNDRAISFRDNLGVPVPRTLVDLIVVVIVYAI